MKKKYIIIKGKKKRRVHKDKRGREYIKESYFVGGKMKFNRIFLIEGIPEDEFYENNATDLDHYINGDYELMSCNQYPSEDIDNKNNDSDQELFNDEDELPF